jgi:hypothetical protein
MDGVRVARWRKYGRDRLYVTADEGTRLGWHDLATGQTYAELPARFDVLHAAIAAWQAEHTADRRTPLRPRVAPTAAAPAEVSVNAPAARIAPPESPGNGAGAGSVDIHPDRPRHDPAVEPRPSRADVESERPGVEDLADRRAGVMAREQAVALKQAAPVRTFVARLLGVHTDERAWRIGADGEEKVAAQLAKLARKDPRWRFLHAIPVGENGSDIDHLVIGPGGVYTLNAKHHPGGNIWVGGGTFRVNGHRQPYLRNSRHEASRAARLLSAACARPVSVTGVVVPVGADSLIIRHAPTDVHVVNRMGLVKWLRARRDQLDPAAVDAVYEAARRSTTWQPGAK